MIVSTLLETGLVVPNYVAPAASWDALNSHTLTVPADKKWFLIGGQVTRDAAETLVITITDGTNTILTILNAGAAAQTDPFPNSTLMGNMIVPIPLMEGYEIVFTFGGNQGAGAAISCMVVEVYL